MLDSKISVLGDGSFGELAMSFKRVLLIGINSRITSLHVRTTQESTIYGESPDIPLDRLDYSLPSL